MLGFRWLMGDVDRSVYVATLVDVDRSVYNGGMNAPVTPFTQDLPARDRILLTAHDLFYRDGIRATGIDRVIAAAGVTKVTFYRHFPSKNDLILAFLDYRHQRWITWFRDALHRHGGFAGAGVGALLPALAEWLGDPAYRGCAFINTAVELGGVMPEALQLARSHKADMTLLIVELLPAATSRDSDAQAIALLVDGAIVRAQLDQAADGAITLLTRLLQPWLADCRT